MINLKIFHKLVILSIFFSDGNHIHLDSCPSGVKVTLVTTPKTYFTHMVG